MRNAVLVLVLTGCCFSPTPSPTPVVAPAPVAPVGASGPGAPGCPELPTTLVGTWTHDTLVEEYRADGAYVLNGVVGTYRFASPGHIVIEEPSAGVRGEFDVGLADPATLVVIDFVGVGIVYTRTTAAPDVPASCFDLTAVFARTWSPRPTGTPETYSADGTYQVEGAGRWSFTAPGRLRLVRDADALTTDYVVAMPTTTTMLAVGAGHGQTYDAVP